MRLSFSFSFSLSPISSHPSLHPAPLYSLSSFHSLSPLCRLSSHDNCTLPLSHLTCILISSWFPPSFPYLSSYFHSLWLTCVTFPLVITVLYLSLVLPVSIPLARPPAPPPSTPFTNSFISLSPRFTYSGPLPHLHIGLRGTLSSYSASPFISHLITRSLFSPFPHFHVFVLPYDFFFFRHSSCSLYRIPTSHLLRSPSLSLILFLTLFFPLPHLAFLFPH